MERLRLHIPDFSELWYRQKLLADPDTMYFNRSSDSCGCIDFPDDGFYDWYNYWINGFPMRYYAYVVRISGGTFIGEVWIYKNDIIGSYEDYYKMGIIIENVFRCVGYGSEAIKLLLDVAFCELGAASVHNSFESFRLDALKTHLNSGFKVDCYKNHICNLSVTARDYYNSRKSECST